MPQQKRASKTSEVINESVVPGVEGNTGLSAFGAKLLLPVFIIYAIGVIFGVINHESWADEGQAWLLVEGLDLRGLFGVLPSEGHPPLWYLVLFPFAKLGFPYATVKWVSGLLTIGAMYLLLFRTKVPVLLKLAVPFSYYFFYLYAIFGRSYCLIAFFVMALVALHPKRFEKPWLYALCIVAVFNTHMLFFTFTFGLMFLYLVEMIQYKLVSKQRIAALVFMAVGGLYLIPFFASNKLVQHFEKLTVDHTLNVKVALTYGLVLFNEYVGIGIILFLALMALLVTRTKVLYLFLCGISGIFYIMAFRYSHVQPRHYGIIVYVVVACYSFAHFYKEDKFNVLFKNGPDLTKYGYYLLSALLFLQVPVALINHRADTTAAYSGAKDAADFLMDNNLEHSILSPYYYWSAHGILPYLPKDVKFYDAQCQRYTRHYIFDECFMSSKKFTGADAIRVTREKFKDRLKDVILIFNAKINLKYTDYLELIYETPTVPMYTSETFFMYRFKDVPDTDSTALQAAR